VCVCVCVCVRVRVRVRVRVCVFLSSLLVNEESMRSNKGHALG